MHLSYNNKVKEEEWEPKEISCKKNNLRVKNMELFKDGWNIYVCFIKFKKLNTS